MAQRLWMAIQAFLKVWLDPSECRHSRVNLLQAPGFCPDCGYKVRILWNMVLCRDCSARRVAKRTVFGEIKPLHTYCRHCGSDHYRVVKKHTIEAYELIYAVSIVSTVFNDEEGRPLQPPVANPFKASATVEDETIIDAEVIRKEEVRGTRRPFATTPFQWQTQQDPSRYGARPKLLGQGRSENVLPFKKIG